MDFDQATQDLRRALPSQDFLRELCADARELVIGCAIHVCSPSCFKYRAAGASQICRHGFYHVATFYDDDENEVSRRRNGKALRGPIFIYRDIRWGMAGRILTSQVHPVKA